MPSNKRYLPLPIFLLILTTLVGGVYYFLEQYPTPQSLGINEVTATPSAEAIAACQGKNTNASCSYQYCPPMHPCPTGRMCAQVMPDCINLSGICSTESACAAIKPTITIGSSTNPTKTYLNQSTELDLNARSISDKLTGVELKLSYNPSNLDITHALPTDYLPITLASSVIGTGILSTTLGVKPESGGHAEEGVIAKIAVTSLTLGTHQIKFDNTIITTINSKENGLLSSTPIEISVFNRGDLNYSKTVDLFDYSLLISGYGNQYNLFDYNDLLANYGKTSP